MGSNRLVYRYGLLAPIEGGQEARQQMWLAHLYRNTLTEIERGRRDATRRAMDEAGDAAEIERQARGASEELEDAYGAIRLERARNTAAGAKPSRATSAHAKLRLDLAKANKKEAIAKFREHKRLIREDPRILASLDRITDLAGQLKRSARAHCGVYWGTYLLVEDAMQAASRVPLFDRNAEPNDPHFERWDGQGSVGVQIQIHSPIVRFDSDARIRIEPVPDRNGRPDSPWAILWFRVKSDGPNNTTPVWAKLPMKMHRPLPVGAKIKSAAVHLRKIGPREEWSVTFTLDTSAVARPDASTNAAVGVDIGWRMIDGRMRVAIWHGSDGSEGEFDISESVISGLRKCEELRSIRDKNFDVAKDMLVKWLTSPSVHLDAVPSPNETKFRARTKHLALWKSPARLAGLVQFWKHKRFDGDDEIFGEMEAWRYHDHHLWSWEANQRKSALRHRRDIYRCYARSLADSFGAIVLERFNLSDVATKPPVENDTSDNARARSNRQLAAVSELRIAMINAFNRAGSVITVDAKNTTRECHKCGVVEIFDAAAKIDHTCPNGHEWDQDVNAAKNLLIRWRERPEDAIVLGGARNDENDNENEEVKESRWAVARRKRTERDSRKRALANASATHQNGLPF